MFSYDTTTAVRFVLIAIGFALICGFIAWRVVKSWERDSKDAAESHNSDTDQPHRNTDTNSTP